MAMADTLAMLKGARNKYSRNVGKTVQLKEGKTKVRIFQTPDSPQFWRDAGQFWIKADPNGKPLAVCGSKAVAYTVKDEHNNDVPMPCEVTDFVEQAIMGASNDDELKLYKSWRARKFVLVCARIYDGADAGPEPQILQLTPNTFSDFLSIMETYAEAGVDALSLDKGIDVVFERRGKGLDTEYTVMAAPKHEPQSADMLKKLPNLDAFIEKEYFRPGDDRKALVAIGTITGTPYSGAPALPAPASSRTGALTGPAAKLAELSAPVTPVAPVTPPAPAAVVPPAPVAPVAPAVVETVEAEDEDERLMREAQERIAAKKAAKAAAEAAAAAPAPVATPAVAAATVAGSDTFNAPLDMDDLAATLAELENI